MNCMASLLFVTQSGQFVQLQTISFGRGFIMALDFHLLPECEGMLGEWLS